jgi:hypothetical protein
MAHGVDIIGIQRCPTDIYRSVIMIAMRLLIYNVMHNNPVPFFLRTPDVANDTQRLVWRISDSAIWSSSLPNQTRPPELPDWGGRGYHSFSGSFPTFMIEKMKMNPFSTLSLQLGPVHKCASLYLPEGRWQCTVQDRQSNRWVPLSGPKGAHLCQLNLEYMYTKGQRVLPVRRPPRLLVSCVAAFLPGDETRPGASLFDRLTPFHSRLGLLRTTSSESSEGLINVPNVCGRRSVYKSNR